VRGRQSDVVLWTVEDTDDGSRRGVTPDRATASDLA
jgi:hypothetical protein